MSSEMDVGGMRLDPSATRLTASMTSEAARDLWM